MYTDPESHNAQRHGFFLFTGRDVAITMNSVKILHLVRSAITAIAELLVFIYELHPSPFRLQILAGLHA